MYESGSRKFVNQKEGGSAEGKPFYFFGSRQLMAAKMNGRAGAKKTNEYKR